MKTSAVKTSASQAARSRRSRRLRSAPLAEINVVPLVDVVLVLLIIFMATAVFTKDSALDLRLPLSQSGKQATAAEKIDIAVTRTGQTVLNGHAVDEAFLAGQLQLVSRRNGATLVSIRADERVAYARVVRIMDLARGAGLSRIALGTRAENGK